MFGFLFCFPSELPTLKFLDEQSGWTEVCGRQEVSELKKYLWIEQKSFLRLPETWAPSSAALWREPGQVGGCGREGGRGTPADLGRGALSTSVNGAAQRTSLSSPSRHGRTMAL